MSTPGGAAEPDVGRTAWIQARTDRSGTKRKYDKQLDSRIDHYRMLALRITDQQTNNGIKEII